MKNSTRFSKTQFNWMKIKRNRYAARYAYFSLSNYIFHEVTRTQSMPMEWHCFINELQSFCNSLKCYSIHKLVMPIVATNYISNNTFRNCPIISTFAYKRCFCSESHFSGISIFRFGCNAHHTTTISLSLFNFYICHVLFTLSR